MRPVADRWYFAYGSNMSIDQKERRTGKIRESCPAVLKNHRLVFNKDDGKGSAYANIEQRTGSEVWGVIYLCNLGAFKELDRFEGVTAGHYVQEEVEVVTDKDEKVLAVAYVAGKNFVCPERQPRADYLEIILTGAYEHKLPSDYIKELSKLR